MRRSFFAVLAILALVTLPAIAQEVKPTVSLPVYPSGEATMELDLSNADILPMLKAALPMLLGKFPSVADKVSVEDVAAVFADVKQIQFSQIDITKANTATEDVLSYYGKNMPVGSWSRIFWQATPKSGTMAVYAQSGGESLYGYRVQNVSEDGKPAKRVQVVKIGGKIDLVKLVTVGSKFFGMGF